MTEEELIEEVMKEIEDSGDVITPENVTSLMRKKILRQKRGISKKSQIIQNAIYSFMEGSESRVTVRQVYYMMTVRGVIPKTEAGYRQVCYQLKNMRLSSRIPFGWIADNTRWSIKPKTYSGLEAALNFWQDAYRRDLWLQQPVYVEIWVEKDALAGVISDITRKYDVPLMVVRGYSSMTFLYECAEEIKRIGKPAYIYHFGDHDPSGVDAAYKVRDGLIEHGADINYERAAVTMDQIEEFNLPTRPTKKTDPRFNNWGDKPSVELDALPPDIFRAEVEQRIIQHIDSEILMRTEITEEQERETLASMHNDLNLY